MDKIKLFCIILCLSITGYSQTYVEGKVVDEDNYPLMYALIKFENSDIKVITDFEGNFKIKDSGEKHKTLNVSLIGYTSKNIRIRGRKYIKITLQEGENLNEVVLTNKKQPKKNNPAINILRNIWDRKKKNSLDLVDYYEFEKYEKYEFDLNNLDFNLIGSSIFNGMEFIFNNIDTSNLNGKTYLPIYISESYNRVYGNNKINTEKEELLGSKSSDISSNDDNISEYSKQLYTEYNTYDDFIELMNKKFMSPLSKFGINGYSYLLSDTLYINNKRHFNIIFYPRRKNEMTFEGSLVVSDSNYFVRSIEMQISEGSNINWVRGIRLEQYYKILNDSMYILEKDYIEADLSIFEDENAKGIYGKRTTLYDFYEFNKKKKTTFYLEESDNYREEVYSRDNDFWKNHRLEKLTENEKKIYTTIDTLKKVPKFKFIYNLGNTFITGYYNFLKLGFSYGPLVNSIGYNDIEKVRIRVGGRTFKSINDKKRINAYIAYGTGDKKIKYGIIGKYMVKNFNRLIFSLEHRSDVEQLGNRILNNSSNLIDRSLASSSIFSIGKNYRLTNIKLYDFGISVEPIKNITFGVNANYRNLSSASERFSIDYLNSEGQITGRIDQLEIKSYINFTIGREISGFGLYRKDIRPDYYKIYLGYEAGIKNNFLKSDLNYHKINIFYSKIYKFGFIGRLRTSINLGKTIGAVPLLMLDAAPANQSLFKVNSTFTNMHFYEFVSDQHIFLDIEDNLNGLIFNKIPFLKKLKLREVIGIRGIWGNLSDKNISINKTNIPLVAPSKEPYWEYSFGITNILKVFRIDFNFRGNYLNHQNVQKFKVTGKVEILF